MKKYTITVNGTAYEVTVEENGASAPVAAAAPAPAAAPAAKAAPAPAAAPSGAAGAKKVNAGVAGKVLKIETSVGQAVKSGDTVLVLEAMKMEIPVVAPEDGTIAGFEVKVGDSVEAGDLLATMN